MAQVTDVGGTPMVMTTSGGGNGDGMGGNWIWAFLLFAILGGGGGGFGGGNRNQDTTWMSQQLSQIDNGIRGLGQGLCDTTYALNNSIKDGNFATNMAIQEGKYQTGNAICTLGFEGERNTNAIIQSGTANTQRILDWLCASEKSSLSRELCKAEQLLSEARIIASMKPQAAIPAYNVPNPFVPFGCGGCC